MPSQHVLTSRMRRFCRRNRGCGPFAEGKRDGEGQIDVGRCGLERPQALLKAYGDDMQILSHYLLVVFQWNYAFSMEIQLIPLI